MWLILCSCYGIFRCDCEFVSSYGRLFREGGRVCMRGGVRVVTVRVVG